MFLFRLPSGPKARGFGCFGVGLGFMEQGCYMRGHSIDSGIDALPFKLLCRMAFSGNSRQTDLGKRVDIIHGLMHQERLSSLFGCFCCWPAASPGTLA